MNAPATAANLAWWLSNLPHWRAFKRAIINPAAQQQRLLQRLIRRSASTAFGRQHRLAQVSNYREFAERVPIRDYDEIEPWIARIARGEPNVLTPDPVIRLVPTSGTSGARKLIPYTAQLQAEFNRAIGPWIVDLFHATPSLTCGSAYWSITPLTRDDRAENSAIPIGFEDDGAYLGGIRRRIIDAIMAVGPEAGHASTLEECRRLTVQHLLRCRDLRIMSVWHPSFLTLLLQDVKDDVSLIWPKLRLISCWGDGHAALSVGDIRNRFPGVTIQPKGLIATEAVVSIPFRCRWPLAVRSHFFEFLTEAGHVVRAHELELGRQYQVIVTTGGGLWRYRLNDIVVVEGFVSKTPSIRFVSKCDNFSDRFGEKLSDCFVAKAIARLRGESSAQWSFAMLAPEGSGYVLFVEGDVSGNVACRLDAMLRDNPQYSYCRDLGQLGPARVFQIQGGAYHAFVARLGSLGLRAGDMKAAALSRLDGWSRHFNGFFSGRSSSAVEEPLRQSDP